MTPFLRKHRRAFKVLFGCTQIVLLCDLLLLVTGLEFRWWHLPVGASIRHTLLVLLVCLCTFYGLLYTFILFVGMYSDRKRKQSAETVQQNIIYAESSLLMLLCAVWGIGVLAGAPSAKPLWLCVVVAAVAQIVFLWRAFNSQRHKRNPH